MYSETVKKHFMNPHNQSEMKDADAIGKVGNPTCGDVMWIYIKVNPKSLKIEKISFQTMGCAAAISTSSMITDLAIGKTLDEAEKITNNDVAEALEGLPPPKLHCSNLAADGLHNAILEYKYKNKMITKEERDKKLRMKVCHH